MAATDVRGLALLLAGFLLAESTGASPEECLRSGIRYGSAAAALPGTQAPTPADLLPGDVPVRALPPVQAYQLLLQQICVYLRNAPSS